MYTLLILWSSTTWVIHYYMGNCSVNVFSRQRVIFGREINDTILWYVE